MVGKGLSPKVRMVAKGSPKLNRLVAMASSMKKKASPKCGGARKTTSSPQVQQRAYWNPPLEKSLVDVLHNHKDCRADNGCFITETWNSIVKEFHAKNQYARYNKIKIQEKERELKRDYKMLKEALKKSRCSWNHNRSMIEAEPHLWENLKVSFPKIKKFQNPKASFPLFDALGELYDGHLAEGNHSFTSLEIPQDEEPLRQIHDEEDDVQVLDDIVAEEVQIEDPRDDEIEVVETRADNVSIGQEAEALATAQKTGQQRRFSAATKQDKKEERESKKAKKSTNLERMMETYMEMRNKQLENETTLLAREKQHVEGADFSIKRCISVLNKMKVTSVKKVKAYSVFKSADNREIFLSSYEEDEETALMWLRTEIAPQGKE